MKDTPALQIKHGRDVSIKRKHPWIYSGAVKEVIGNPSPGDSVKIIDHMNREIAIAAYSPNSSICARIWSFDPEVLIDYSFFKQRIEKAVLARAGITNRNAVRLIHAESDGIPGLIADKYNDWIVIQLLTSGAEKHKNLIVKALIDITGIGNVYERSDAEVRKLEGLPLHSGVLHGHQPPERIEIFEDNLKFHVDIMSGQKTGFYIDQGENRQIIGQYAEKKDVLNCFCYSGGFTINSAACGAKKVTSIDSSAAALELAKENYALNRLDMSIAEWVEADVFQELRNLRDCARQFDLIVLDPPKLAATKVQVEKAARAYKDMNLLAFKLLRNGGYLFTFSCSGGIGKDLFQKIISDAALDAQVNAVIVDRLCQTGDHPVALNFPESEYLKGLICQKRDY